MCSQESFADKLDHCKEFKRKVYITFRNLLGFNGEEFLPPCSTPKLQDRPLLAVRDCLFGIFTASLHFWRSFLHPQAEDAPCRSDIGHS
jgi:hypothetical protein